MRIVSIGGGPAGLYFSLLLKKSFPQVDIEVFEKNKPDDTFGWGVVFSKETLGNFRDVDPESLAAIESRFVYWDDIETHLRGQMAVSTGHGFCGLSRKELLQLLHARCEALGVKLNFNADISPDALPKADLILAADGVHSPIRERFAADFRPHVDWRKCKFTWLGTTKPLRAFTFHFKETPHGLFQVHAYPFRNANDGGAISTFIVECREEVWKAAGLDAKSEAESVAFLEELFKHELGGHRLLANKSIWRTFPTITCDRWTRGNVVLMGDAAHTAHFSIGSGTKLAMEDAIALRDSLKLHDLDVEKSLLHYEASRRTDVIRTQRAAQTSLEWFENSARYVNQPPDQFTFNLMTRSKRITWDNLRLRDPALVKHADETFARRHSSTLNSDGSAPPPMFAPITLRSMKLDNRVVVSPMCQYSAVDGVPNDWHLVHLGSRAMGGAGLVMTEMTDVSPEGRITHGCAGLWNDAQETAWKRVVEFVHQRSHAKIGIQLAHAGRKASCSVPWEGDTALEKHEAPWETFGPSAIPYKPGWHVPRELTPPELDRLKRAFTDAVVRADRAGFDFIEVHMAHGYLLSSFLSPLSNQRTDRYGGSLENRMRWPLEVFESMREAWPQEKPMGVRVSATDWLGPTGQTIEDTVELAKALKGLGCDVIDVSTGGNVPESKPEYGRMYQVPYAEAVKVGADMPVMAVGAILGADHANTVIGAGRADFAVIAREHLSDPYLTHRHAQAERVDSVWFAPQYEVVQPRRR